MQYEQPAEGERGLKYRAIGVMVPGKYSSAPRSSPEV